MNLPTFRRVAAALLVGWGACALGVPEGAQAQLRVDITRGHVAPLPVAIPDFHGSDDRARRIGRDMAQVVADDLRISGLFRTIDKAAFIESPSDFDVQPRFPDWRVINAQALISGHVGFASDGSDKELIRVRFRLWDVIASRQLLGLALATDSDNWRRIAHRIADQVYERITGEGGYFDTRIAYIAESGPADERRKRLAIMDQDGANNRYLTDGANLVLTPRFSPTDQTITFLSYANEAPQIRLFDIEKGRQSVLGDFPGMTFAPRFSPDGKSLAMSMSREGNSDIYLMDVGSRAVVRLTRHPAIDTSPSLSPNAANMVFNSDRGGDQQLYVMDIGTRDVRRISQGPGRYATPVWSPRGDLIAFTKLRDGEFSIGVMRPDGSGERILVGEFLVEGPTWSPNGRSLLYFKMPRPRAGQTRVGPKLYAIDLTGSNERVVATPEDASDPAWSPLRR